MSRNKNLNTRAVVGGQVFVFRTANERNAFEAALANAALPPSGRNNNVTVTAVVADGQTIEPGSPLIDVTVTYAQDAKLEVQTPAASTPGQEIVGLYAGTTTANGGDEITMLLRGELDMKVNGDAVAGAYLRHDDSEPSAASFGVGTDSPATLSLVGDALVVETAGYKSVFFEGPFTTA